MQIGRSDVVVVGGGVIGLAIAWRCLQRGAGVTVLDPAPGSGATHTAAGMLAPVSELHFGEQALLALTVESAARYPSFAAELTEAATLDVGYRRTGTLVAAWDGADLAELRTLRDFAQSLGYATELLTGRELRQLEPALAGGLPGGLFAPDDHQVDNRMLHTALLTAVVGEGGLVQHRSVASVLTSGDRALGVVLDGGDAHEADRIVLAAGAWSAGFCDQAGLPPVHPVKGQTLRLTTGDPQALRHVVRGSVRGSAVYVVPRADGRLVVGASSEEAGFDVSSRAGAVYELLRDAQSLLPMLGEAELTEISTGLRPGTPDNAPLLGRTALDGLLVATGHYRNGILLTPVTADAMAHLVCEDTVPEVIAPFAPTRFTAVPA